MRPLAIPRRRLLAVRRDQRRVEIVAVPVAVRYDRAADGDLAGVLSIKRGRIVNDDRSSALLDGDEMTLDHRDRTVNSCMLFRCAAASGVRRPGVGLPRATGGVDVNGRGRRLSDCGGSEPYAQKSSCQWNIQKLHAKNVPFARRSEAKDAETRRGGLGSRPEQLSLA